MRSPRQAFGIGMLHGLAGTGAVVVLLIAALPGRLEAAAALAVFAPMSIASMALFTSAFAWVLTRPVVAPALPHRAGPGARRVRPDLRALVRRDDLSYSSAVRSGVRSSGSASSISLVKMRSERL